MNSRTLIALATTGFLVIGCNRQPPVVMETAPRPSAASPATPETVALRMEIDTFETTPSIVQGERVKKAFAEVDGGIREMVDVCAKKTGEERLQAARKLADLRACRDAEQVRFLRLEALATRQVLENQNPPPAEGPAEKVGVKIDEAVRRVGDGLRDAAEVIRDQTR